MFFAQSTFNLTVIDVDDRLRIFLHQIPILKHLQIYAIYDWLAYNENKEGAPAQEQGGQIFQNKHRGLLYIFAKSFKYNIALKKLVNSSEYNTALYKICVSFLFCEIFVFLFIYCKNICVSIYILWNMKWARWSLANASCQEERSIFNFDDLVFKYLPNIHQ